MEKVIKNKEYIRFILLAGAIFALTFTIVLKQAQHDTTDYYSHMQQAAAFRSLFPYHITYPLWHFLVYAVYKVGWYLLGGMPLEYACALVTSCVNVLNYIIIQKILVRLKVPAGTDYLAAALCVVMPIYIPWYNKHLYIGQLSPVTWHNPTNMMAKPFALLIFFLLVQICMDIKDSKPVGRKRYIILAALIFGSMLAKPSFFQGIVPGLGLYILISLIAGKFRKWKEYLFLVLSFVPAFLLMLLQFYFAFYTGRGEGMGIGWLETFRGVVPSPLISTLLGLIFPLAYILLNLKKCVRSTAIHLAVLFVFSAWMEYALLYENGVRKYHANLSWASMLAYSVLWVLVTGLFFRDMQNADLSDRKTKIKNTLLLVLWVLHLICGIYYAWGLMTVKNKWM